MDLVVVSVRVPWHRDLVMAGLRAGKPVFCEWPLGANLAEAEEMANEARERGVRGIVGLQGRSDPAVRYARDLVTRGEIGEVLTANLSIMAPAVLERGAGRIWQRERTNGANTMTIAGGHGIDAMCTILGEFAEVSARAVTRITKWHDTDIGQDVEVDSPDSISIAGRLLSGTEVAVQVAAVPIGATGTRLEIYGRDGVIVLTSGGALSTGPNRMFVARGKDALAETQVPDEYVVVPEGTPAGPPRNVASGYARLADVWGSTDAFEPDFDVAVTRHKLIDAIERSSSTGQSVRLG